MPTATNQKTDTSVDISTVGAKDALPSSILPQKSLSSINQSASNNKLYIQQKSREDNPHNNIIVYALAIITLGAAFGNMFLAGKVKRVMNVKIPNFDADSSYRKFQQQAAQEQVRRASQQAARAQYKREGSKSQFQEEYAKYKEYAGDNGPIPSWSSQDRNLYVLGLKRHQCNEVDIKKAFFTLAKTHHPDTLPHDLSPQEKQLRLKKFQEMNQAYQDLIKQVKLMDRAGTHP